MRPRSFVLALAALAAVTPARRGARADERGPEKGVFGLGLIVGEPTGLSAKYYLADDTAVDAAVGAAFIGQGIQAHGDFLWHPLMLERTESFALPAYLGVGVRVLRSSAGDTDHTRFGLRVPVGILFDFTRVPLDAFVEVVGIVDYRTSGDAFGLFLNAGGGVRYYF